MRKRFSESHTRCILNKGEEKSYQVVYDKRQCLDIIGHCPTSALPLLLNHQCRGHWFLTTCIVHFLLQPSICNVSDQGSDMEIDDVTNEIVELMETDDETDLEPSENESDVLWTMERISLKIHLFIDVLITLTFNFSLHCLCSSTSHLFISRLRLVY